MLLRSLSAFTALAVFTIGTSSDAAEITGDYVEFRTCDVYTGPCFANAESGLTGRNAVLAWSVDSGSFRGVELSGLKVVAAIGADRTLGDFREERPENVKAVILVDEKASPQQRSALEDFVKERFAGIPFEVGAVKTSDISINVDHVNMIGKLQAGDASMLTRKLKSTDCVCTNEEIYYPPLSDVDNFAPAYVVNGEYNGGGLKSRWNSVNTRSAFLATFAY